MLSKLHLVFTLTASFAKKFHLHITLVLGTIGTLAILNSAIDFIPDGPKFYEKEQPAHVVYVAPATGVNGFNAAMFCNDPLTEVKRFENPDAAGTTYQLTRIKEGVSESVTLVIDKGSNLVLATHYFDTAIGQQSEPAFLNQDGRTCIEKKAA